MKDVGKLADGTLFAPKYLENKLKFFPYIKEAVCFGHERDRVCAFINIDIDAVGNWAEKRNMPYSGYTDLASRDEVYDLVRECIERVNADLAGEPEIANSQIHRFLILHKELDADDGELTRTRKVRRGFIGEKYAPLVEALYDGSDAVHVEAQVRYEDGRTGTFSADLKIRDAKTFAPRPPRRRHERAGIGEVVLSVRGRVARLRRREGAAGRVVRRARARGARHHRPERRRQELDAQRDQRRLPPAAGKDQVQGQGVHGHGSARGRGAWASRAPSRTSRCSRA